LIVTPLPVKPLTCLLTRGGRVMRADRDWCSGVWSSDLVTVGGVVSGALNVTLLSVLVDAVLPLPAASVATPAPIVASTVPEVVKIGRASWRESGGGDVVAVLVEPKVATSGKARRVKPGN